MSTTTTRRDRSSTLGRFADIGKHIDDLMARTDALTNVRGFIDRELKVGREWIDEIHVQNELGKMEIRERTAPVLDRLEIAYDNGSRRIHGFLEDPSTDPDELRTAVNKELRGLKQEIEAAAKNYGIS